MIKKKPIVIGAFVLVLWVFYVAYEKNQYQSKIVIPPIHNPIEVFPSNACPKGVNCKG